MNPEDSKIVRRMFSIKVEPEDTPPWEENCNGGVIQEAVATVLEDTEKSVTAGTESVSACLDKKCENGIKNHAGGNLTQETGVDDTTLQITVYVGEEELGTEETEDVVEDVTRDEDSQHVDEECGISSALHHDKHLIQASDIDVMSGTTLSDKNERSSSSYELIVDEDGNLQVSNSQLLEGSTSGEQNSDISEVSSKEIQSTAGLAAAGTNGIEYQCKVPEKSLKQRDRPERICMNSSLSEGRIYGELLSLKTTEQPHELILSNESNSLTRKQNCEMTESDKKPFKCQYCQKQFSQKHNCKKHERIHTGEKPFQCQYCGKAFNQTLPLKRHEMTHTGEKPYQCQYCSKSFIQKLHCKTHEMTHTGEKPFKCQFCEKSFAWKQSCKVHELMHTGQRPFKCQYCEKAFMCKQNCENHERVHTGEKPFKCQYCEKEFYQRYQLGRHVMTHTGEKRLKCRFCEMSFIGSRECKTHEMKMHTGEKPFKCQFCGKSFISKQNCKKHETIHTGEKPFKCQYCGKGFSQKFPLDRHEMTHTGERPFKCQFCEKSFISKQNCKKHESVHTGKKPFKCQFCEKGFNLRFRLNKHEEKHAKDVSRKVFCNALYPERCTVASMK